MKLDGKRVLITGASRGIGEELAIKFAGAGARVALVARSEAALKELAGRLGGTADVADLTEPDQVQGLIGRIEADGGPIDVLVNNAALEHAGAFLDLAAADMNGQVHVNLVAPMELSRQAIPGMIQRGGGHIVNISSMGGTNALPGVTSYSATKAGLSHFTAALRAEFKGKPVTTTLVELGPVGTQMMQNLYDYPPTDRAVARVRRLGLIKEVTAEHVARNVLSAVQHDRRHLRMPKRGALYPLLVEAPRRITEWLLIGVRGRSPVGDRRPHLDFELGALEEAAYLGQRGVLPFVEGIAELGEAPGLYAHLILDERERAQPDEGEAAESAAEEIGDLQRDITLVPHAEVADQHNDHTHRGERAGRHPQQVIGHPVVHGCLLGQAGTPPGE